MNKIDKDIVDYFENIKMYRRHIHANPEVGPEQPDTVKYVKEQFLNLEDIVITHKKEKAGLVIDILCASNGPTIAFRADMDALNLSETKSPNHLANKEKFCSLFENKMHACGHDLHTAILISFGKIIYNYRNKLRGKIRLLFQPGEEGYAGAKQMVEAKYLKEVQNVFALHCWPNLEVGQIGLKKGAFFASVDHFLVKVSGIGGHGASPEKASDQILAVSSMISNLQSILSRKISGLDQRVLSIGYINAGNKKSKGVLPSSAEFGGTFRTFDTNVQKKIKEELEIICKNTAKMIHNDCKVDIEYTNSYPQTINDNTSVLKLEEIFSDFIDDENLFLNYIPTLGAEDFSFMLKEVPGALFLIGTNSTNHNINKSVFLHNPTFDPDEKSMLFGIQSFKSIALSLLNNKII